MTTKITYPMWDNEDKEYVQKTKTYENIEDVVYKIFDIRDSMRQGYDITLFGSMTEGYIIRATPKPTSKVGKSMNGEN